MKESCGNCRFWIEVGTKGGPSCPEAIGECHANPPHAYEVEAVCDVEFVGRWPETEFADWCGKWAEKNHD